MYKWFERRFVIGTFVGAATLGAMGFVTVWSIERTEHDPKSHAHEHDSGRALEHDMVGAHDRDREESPNDAAFWDWRVSYPTGRFQSSWYDAAIPQHERLPKSVPHTLNSLGAKVTSVGGVLDTGNVTALGPSPLNWSSVYGMVAGRANVIVTHPKESAIAWFGSDGGGVWKTTNCCGPQTTWQVKTDAPQIANIAISSLVLDPNNPNTLYAGTGDFERNRPFAFGASGLLKSTDGGETWQVLATDVFNPVYSEPTGEYPQRRSISAIAVDPNASNNIAVGTNQGLYFSHDAGTSWVGPCFTNDYNSQRQDITGLLTIANGASTNVIVAIGSLALTSSVRYDLGNNGANGIYRATMPSDKCPVSWSILSRSNNGWPAGTASGVSAASGGNPLGRIDIAVAPGNNKIIYAQVMQMGVWRTSDGGSTWSQTATQPQDFSAGCKNDSYANGIGFEDYNAGLTVSPTDAQTVFLSSIDLWRSTDGGHTFVDLTCGYDNLPSGLSGYVHVDNHARAFVSGNTQQLLIGNDGGVYASADALATSPSFIAINTGVNSIEFYFGDLTPDFNDQRVATRGIVAGAQDNGTSNQMWGPGVTPAASSWLVALGGDGTFAKIEPILQQRWYYSNEFGHIQASVTGPNGNADQVVSPEDPDTFIDWQGDRAGFLSPFDLYKFGDTKSCPAATGCQRMIAGTYRVWESLTGGLPNTSWYINSPDLTKTLSLDGSLSIINKVAFSYTDPSIAVVGTNDGNAWMGFNLGQGNTNSATWVNVTANNAVLPNRPIMDIRTDPLTPGTAYASLAGFDQNTPSTPGHVYKLTCNAGCATFSWENKTGDLPNIPVNAILINPNVPNQAFAGTDWGLYFTDDISANPPQWTRFDAGLPSAMIWDLVIDRGATTLGIFTRSRGAYVWPLPLSSIPASMNLDQHGLTGSWYDPNTAGQGIEIEVFPDTAGAGEGYLFGGWFTFDTTVAGGQRWYSLQGEVTNTSSSAALLIGVADGGNFDAGPTVSATLAGNATIQFSDCSHGTLSYTFTDGSARHGTVPLTRLLTNGDTCSLSGSVAGAATDYLLSGNWYDPSTSGQGFIFDFSPSQKFLFAAWYTFAPNGEQIGGGASQRWYTLQTGDFVNGDTSLKNIPIVTSTGGVFNNPTVTKTSQVGSANIAFQSCNAMTLNYTFTSGSNAGLSKEIKLVRIGPVPQGCKL